MTVNGEHVTAGAPRAGAPGMGLALNIKIPRAPSAGMPRARLISWEKYFAPPPSPTALALRYLHQLMM